MKNNIQQKKKEMLARLFKEKPEVLAAKKLTGAILIVWLMIRIMELCVEYYCVAQGIIQFSAVNTITCLVMLLFLWTIYQGVRTLAYLPLLGCIFMIIQTFTEQIYALLSVQYILPIRIYGALFIFAAYAQLILLLYLMGNAKSTLYFDEVKAVMLKLNLGAQNKAHTKH